MIFLEFFYFFRRLMTSFLWNCFSVARVSTIFCNLSLFACILTLMLHKAMSLLCSFFGPPRACVCVCKNWTEYWLPAKQNCPVSSSEAPDPLYINLYNREMVATQKHSNTRINKNKVKATTKSIIRKWHFVLKYKHNILYIHLYLPS